MSLRTVSLSVLHADRPRPVALVAAGRIDKSALMRKAVAVAHSIRTAGLSWQSRMRIGLRQAWRCARREVEEAAAVAALQMRFTPAATRKLVLDRGQAIALIARIQGAPINRGRDLVGDASRLPGLEAVLQLARDEVRALPAPDRASVLASLTGAKPAARRPVRTWISGASAHSHGW